MKKLIFTIFGVLIFCGLFSQKISHQGTLLENGVPVGQSETVIKSSLTNALSGTLFYSKNSDLYKMNLQTLEEDTILATTYSEHYIFVSPDKSKLAYSTDEGSSRRQTWTMNMDGSNKTKLTGSLDWVAPGGWMGDELLLTAYEPYGSGGSVWKVDLNTNTYTQLYFSSSYDTEVKHGWYSEDTIIATRGIRYGGDGGALMKLPVDGSGTPDILWSTTSYCCISQASISHDKTKILFVVGNPANIYLHDLQTSSTTELVTNASMPVWSPYDQHFLFWRDNDLWISDISGTVEQVTFDGVSRLITDWISNGLYEISASDETTTVGKEFDVLINTSEIVDTNNVISYQFCLSPLNIWTRLVKLKTLIL